MHSCRFERGWDYSSHQIACREAPNALLSGQIASGKPGAVDVGATMAPPASCLDGERQTLPLLDSCDVPDAKSIIGMGLPHPPSCPVPTSSPATPRQGGQSQVA